MSGKLVVVIGVGGGIGCLILFSFVECGVSLFVVDFDLEVVECSVELVCVFGVMVYVYQVDVGDIQVMEIFVEWVCDIFGVLDVVVSNVGIGMVGLMFDILFVEWECLLWVNLWSVIDGCCLFGWQMIVVNKLGYLVNVVFGVVFVLLCNYFVYVISKVVVLMFSECLWVELVGCLIGVIVVCLGFVDIGIVQVICFVGMDVECQVWCQVKIQCFYK